MLCFTPLGVKRSALSGEVVGKTTRRASLCAWKQVFVRILERRAGSGARYPALMAGRLAHL